MPYQVFAENDRQRTSCGGPAALVVALAIAPIPAAGSRNRWPLHHPRRLPCITSYPLMVVAMGHGENIPFYHIHALQTKLTSYSLEESWGSSDVSALSLGRTRLRPPLFARAVGQTTATRGIVLLFAIAMDQGAIRW